MRKVVAAVLFILFPSISHAGIFGGGGSSTPAMVEVKDTEIALKTGVVSTAVEAVALIGILEGSRHVANAKWNPMLSGMPLVRWLSILLVVFGSATIRSALDGTMSAAAQTLQPTVVPGDPDWYEQLRKPFFNPPAWVFPIMWLLIAKPTQVLALKELFSVDSASWKTLIPYGVHLALGDTWNQVFFQHQRIGLGAIIISCFWVSLFIAVLTFDTISELSATCLLPSLGWITIASLLNLEIYRLNPPRKAIVQKKKRWWGR